ncbi:hypothetical protein Tco_1220194 [Tanacetum coccineum]
MKEVSKESGAKRKKSIPRKSTRGTVKRQKMELDDEKEELKGYLDIVPREDVAEDIESLSTKFPIVDWKTYVLTENFMYYQIFRGDGSSKNYKVLSEMLEDFDRQDVMDLHRLVKERYSASRPEGYDLMLWGDLHTLFEPDEEDEMWKNQHEYNLLSWSLYDLCGVHILLMQNGIAIHMFTEKKYPLSQEMLSKMLSKRLEVDHESTQAYELLKFIRSQRLVARRANDHVSITAPDDKNLNKNNIKEIYLLIMNSKVPDYADTRLLWSLSVFIRSTVIWERVRDFQLRIESYQQKVNLTTPTMTFPGIKDHEIYEDRLKHRRQIEDGNVMIEDHLDQEEERLKIIGTLRNCICNKIVKALKHKDFLKRSMTTGNVFILWHCCFQSDIGRANLNSL